MGEKNFKKRLKSAQAFQKKKQKKKRRKSVPVFRKKKRRKSVPSSQKKKRRKSVPALRRRKSAAAWDGEYLPEDVYANELAFQKLKRGPPPKGLAAKAFFAQANTSPLKRLKQDILWRKHRG